MPPTRNISQKAAAELLDKLEKHIEITSKLSVQLETLSTTVNPVLKSFYGNGKMPILARLEVIENMLEQNLLSINKNTDTINHRELLPECKEKMNAVNASVASINKSIAGIATEISGIHKSINKNDITSTEHQGALNTLLKWKNDQSSFKSKILVETFKLIIAVASGVILAKLSGIL